jgi:quercetin dioxygenase-like cupin family protein
MELIRPGDTKVLSNPGVASVQLLSPANSQSVRVALTKVTVQPGHEQPRHIHKASEQIWIATSGEGLLLLADDETQPLKSGEVARFGDGEIHGFLNNSDQPFEYLSVTTPPIDFGYAYAKAE